MNYEITELEAHVLSQTDPGYTGSNEYLSHGKHYVSAVRPATQAQANDYEREYSGEATEVAEHRLSEYVHLTVRGAKTISIASVSWFDHHIAWKRAERFNKSEDVREALLSLCEQHNSSILLRSTHIAGSCWIERSENTHKYNWKRFKTVRLNPSSQESVEQAWSNCIKQAYRSCRFQVTSRLSNMVELMSQATSSYVGRRGSRKLCRDLESTEETYPARQYVRGRQLQDLSPPNEAQEMNPADSHAGIVGEAVRIRQLERADTDGMSDVDLREFEEFMEGVR